MSDLNLDFGNTRLAKLVEQCYNRYSQHNIDLEKFAELIVQECMEVCKSRVGNSDYTTGRMHCASDIKEHFYEKEVT